MTDMTREVRTIQNLWRESVMWNVPSHEQCIRWLVFHTPQTITSAVRATGARMRYRSMTLDHAIRHCSKLCNDKTFALYEQSKRAAQQPESAHAA